MGHLRGIPVFFNDLMWSVSIDAGRIGVQSVGNRYPSKTTVAAGSPPPMPNFSRSYAALAPLNNNSNWRETSSVRDRVPHGCGTRAYMDVFTACLKQTKSLASSTLNISGLLPYYTLSPGLLVPHDRVFQRADTFVSADRPVAILQVDRRLACRAHT